MAIDMLKPGRVRDISLAVGDAATAGASDMAAGMDGGACSNGPLMKVAWAFDGRGETSVRPVTDKDGNPMGLGYIKWGQGDNTPSVIPPLAMSSPYTAAPLRYIADLTAGLGPKLMYRFADEKLVEFKDAGDILRKKVEELEKAEPKDDITLLRNNGITEGRQESAALKRARKDLEDWERTWLGVPETEDDNRVPGAKEFLEENNLNLHLSQCEQDDVMLDMYFPTVGFHDKGRRGLWKPVINRIGMLPAHSTRLEKMNEHRFINHVYFSDSLRTKGIGGVRTVQEPGDQKFVMYPACMPQRLLRDMRQIVIDNQKTSAGRRPMWVVCPTFYPSLNKPYYPQPAWWSVFTSKAFDFSATILYDKYKARENSTSWGKIIYISLDYLNMVFADEGIEGDKEAQAKFIEELDQNVEQFLKQRENNGKMMRQWMWQGQGDKTFKNVEIVDVNETVKDAVQAGKDELELATSPIFLALCIDPRLVGVPMVKSSNGGTALREMHLLKQQQLNVKQRLYLHFLNSVVKFNGWDEHAQFEIIQQTLTTLDNSKTGMVETVAGDGA